MAYALIWVESLATALLVVVLVTAWAARRTRNLLRVAPPVLAALLLVGPAALLTGGVDFLVRRGAMEGFWTGYVLAWTVALAVGAAIVTFGGLRRSSAEEPAARAWPRARLALGLAT